MDVPVLVGYNIFRKQSPHITIYYPFVMGLENRQAEININATIVSTINATLVDLGYHDSNLQELIGQFEIKTNSRGILSLTITVYSFTGGAHGMTVVKSLLFSSRTGYLYGLHDLFSRPSDYITKLSNIIDTKIKEWDIPLFDEFTKIRDDQDFYLADHALVLYFQLYEITPYAVGFPYFTIPLLDIQEMIKPNGPLEQFLHF